MFRPRTLLQFLLYLHDLAEDPHRGSSRKLARWDLQHRWPAGAWGGQPGSTQRAQGLFCVFLASRRGQVSRASLRANKQKAAGERARRISEDDLWNQVDFWRAAVVRQGQEQARPERCHWRAKAGVPGAKGNRRGGRRLSAVVWLTGAGLGQERGGRVYTLCSSMLATTM